MPSESAYRENNAGRRNSSIWGQSLEEVCGLPTETPTRAVQILQIEGLHKKGKESRME